jgi:hypothetical protein
MITYESSSPLPPYSLLTKETTALIIAQAQIAMGVWLALLASKEGRNATINVTGSVVQRDHTERVYTLKCTVRREHE